MTRPRTRGWLSAFLTLLVLSVLFVPGSAVPQVGFSGIDIVVHIALFASWSAAVRYEFPRLPSPVILLVGAVLALGTELVQTTIAGRSFSHFDILADITGVLLGWTLMQLWLRRKARICN